MLTLSIDGDTRVIAKLDAAIKAVGSPREALEDSGKYIISEVDKQFSTSGSRLGTSWQALSQKTLIQKAQAGYGGKGILERTGKLKKGFTSDLETFKVTVSNPVTYFKYHQLGTNKIPQRPMLVSSTNLKAGIVEIFNKFIKKAFA